MNMTRTCYNKYIFIFWVLAILCATRGSTLEIEEEEKVIGTDKSRADHSDPEYDSEHNHPLHAFYDHSFVKEYRSGSELLSAVNRPGVCTFVLFGALWDGYYKQFVAKGVWQALAKEARTYTKEERLSLEFGYFHYTGTEEGGIPAINDDFVTVL